MGKIPIILTPYPHKKSKAVRPPSPPKEESFDDVDEETTLAGVMPLQSAVGLLLTFYYIISVVALHNLVSKGSPSVFECAVATVGFSAVLLAFSGLYRRRPKRFIPLQGLQVLTFVALLDIWVKFAMEQSAGYYHQRINKTTIAVWVARYLFTVSLAIMHAACFYTVRRYVKMLNAIEANEDSMDNESDSSFMGVPDNGRILFGIGKDDSCYEVTEERGPPKKSVTFSV